VAPILMNRLPSRIDRRPPHQLVGREPKNPLRARITSDNPPLLIMQDDTFCQRSHHPVVPLGRLAQRFCQASCFRDIVHHVRIPRPPAWSYSNPADGGGKAQFDPAAFLRVDIFESHRLFRPFALFVRSVPKSEDVRWGAKL